MKRIAVVVPGIMGSVLYYEDAGGHRTEIWGENLLHNYHRLLDNPTLLNWGGDVAQASLLENVYVSRRIPRAKLRFWKRLLDFLAGHVEFGLQGRTLKVGYDWRRSLPEAAADFADDLDKHAFASASGHDFSGDEVRFTFFTHSMGGLLVRCAIGQGLVKPEQIDRVIHLGSPLEGAPVAFQAAYHSGRIPLLRELSSLIHWKNSQQFYDHLLQNLQTFPSMYQLMPPQGVSFLFYSQSDRRNPLDDSSCIPAKHRKTAVAAHGVLREAERIIIAKQIPTYTIYTDYHGQKQTEMEFRVEDRPPDQGYRVVEVFAKTSYGDGTVPRESARGGFSSTQKPVFSVAHGSMCNDKKVVALLPTIL